MAKKIKTVDGTEGEVHPNGESELGVSPVPTALDDAAKDEALEQAPEPEVDQFGLYINAELQWFRRASFGDQRGYHTAATVQSRGFLLLAELLIALEHRLGRIERELQKANNG